MNLVEYLVHILNTQIQTNPFQVVTLVLPAENFKSTSTKFRSTTYINMWQNSPEAPSCPVNNGKITSSKSCFT